MKTVKRLLALLLALGMLLTLAACGTAQKTALPESLSGRKLSDEELLALKPGDPEAMRAAIATVEDAAAWLSLSGYLVSGQSLRTLDEFPDYLICFPAVFLLTNASKGVEAVIFSDEASRVAAWLLQDDYPGTGILASIDPIKGYTELLCIPADGGAYAIDAAALAEGKQESCRFCEEQDGKLAWPEKPLSGETAIVTDLSNPWICYQKRAFLGRERLEMILERPSKELASLPTEEETARFLRAVGSTFGISVAGAGATAATLAEYGMRRLDEGERTALLGGRKRSDAELAALGYDDLDALRAALSTPEDVAAWLRLQDFAYWDGAMVYASETTNRSWYPTPDFMLKPTGLSESEETYIGRDSINLLAAWLLQDDFDDCGALIVLVPENHYGYSNFSAVCIGQRDEHVLLNMAAMIEMVTMSGSVSREEPLDGLAIRDLNRLAAYLDYVQSANLVGHSEIALVRDLDHTIEYESYGSYACFSDRACVLFAQLPEQDATEYLLSHGARGQEWAFLDFDINAFPVPAALGGSRLSEAEIEGLVGQDVDVVAAKVNTVADLISYLHAGGFSYGNCDIWEDDADSDELTWHFNKSARTANLTRCIDCGAMANLVRYVLDGDYERVGFVCHTYPNGEGGGHIYNYLYDGGRYYVMDLTQVTGSHFQPDALRILEMGDLAEFAVMVLTDFSSPYVGYGSYLPVIYAYDAEEDIPLAWKKEGDDACSVTWYPTGTVLEMIYEDQGAGYSVDFRDMPKQTAAAISKSRPDAVNTWSYYRPEAFPGVEAFGFPAAFGQTSMSYEEMLQLVWTADTETLAKKIKTIPDVMMYFCAAGYSGDEGEGGSDLSLEEADGLIWHYNEYAERTRWQSSHACGQCAATVRYLLDGDYDEVGYISCTWAEGQGGGHNFNYFRIGGEYYVLDMNLYDVNDYDPSVRAFLKIGPELSAFRSLYGQLYSEDMVCCYASPLLREIPVGWERDNVKTSFLPERYENDIRILWTAEDEGYTYRFVPLDERMEEYMDRFRAA